MKQFSIEEIYFNKLNNHIHSLEYLQRDCGNVMSSILQKQINKFKEKIKTLNIKKSW